MKAFLLIISVLSLTVNADDWQKLVGKPGDSGWMCNVIQPDPKNHGPDGINLYDWDGDGLVDLFVNYEEGKYSRLFFNPGKEKVKGLWTDFIEFKHGKCEDSGIGDLDNDGDIDYIANGGWLYFNPGKEAVRDAGKWKKMVLFNNEGRVPTVVDIDGDGLNDLMIAGKEWYKQPEEDKYNPANWQKFTLGNTKWVMNSIVYDVDKDGDLDIVVQDRKTETFWYENQGGDKLYQPWPKKSLFTKNKESMFMTIGDVNADGKDDFIITGGRIGELKQKLIILLRKNSSGVPEFDEVIIEQPAKHAGLGIDWFPKGVTIQDLNNDGIKEILVTPKLSDIWIANYDGDSRRKESWKTKVLDTPGYKSRKKMDNAYPADIDGDGDIDIVTTEENGGWGVIWFENPAR